MSIMLAPSSLGKRDVTPDAVNWANIGPFLTPGNASNANQTISGISSSITLQVSWSGTMTLEYNINDGASTGISNGGTLSISNGQTLNFTGFMDATDVASVSVANQSDGGATLDTFLVTGT